MRSRVSAEGERVSAVSVLLVEDEGLVRMIVAEFLSDEGFRVTEACDGDEAARLLDGAHGFDVLFTDVRMPGALDGLDVALRARQQRPGLPVLIVSGYSDQLSGRLCAFDPAAAFLGKPYRLTEIVSTLKCLAEKPACLEARRDA